MTDGELSPDSVSSIQVTGARKILMWSRPHSNEQSFSAPHGRTFTKESMIGPADVFLDSTKMRLCSMHNLNSGSKQLFGGHRFEEL